MTGKFTLLGSTNQFYCNLDVMSNSSGGSPSEGHHPPRGSPRKFASQGALRGSLRVTVVPLASTPCFGGVGGRVNVMYNSVESYKFAVKSM